MEKQIQRNEKGQFLKGFISKYRNIPILNKKYGLFTVISEEVVKSKDGKIMFFVECECKKQMHIRAYFLESGRQKSCKSCASKRAYTKLKEEGKSVGFIKLNHEGVGNISKSFYGYIKQGAKVRNIPFDKDVTIDYLWNLYLSQNKKCNLSGLDILISSNRKNGNVDFSSVTASLDRIDNNKGYSIGNLQWLHKDVNRMKWAFDQEKLLKLCELIANKNKTILSQAKV